MRKVTATGRPGAADQAPWIAMGVAIAATLALLLVMLVRESLARQAQTRMAVAPDSSGVSPRERFDGLYTRVMRAAQSGDESTVAAFTPIALMAYAQLDTLDADARYHAALLRVHTGDLEAAGALGDTVLAETPGHLFGYIIQGTVGRWQKDDAALGRAYAGFLGHYDAEIKAGRPEYQEHTAALDGFRRAALEAKPAAKSGP